MAACGFSSFRFTISTCGTSLNKEVSIILSIVKQYQLNEEFQQKQLDYDITTRAQQWITGVCYINAFAAYVAAILESVLTMKSSLQMHTRHKLGHIATNMPTSFFELPNLPLKYQIKPSVPVIGNYFG